MVERRSRCPYGDAPEANCPEEPERFVVLCARPKLAQTVKVVRSSCITSADVPSKKKRTNPSRLH
jgi:hypothetical protein